MTTLKILLGMMAIILIFSFVLKITFKLIDFIFDKLGWSYELEDENNIE